MTLPELHLADWRPTKDTLHLYAQILGKIRLATTSPRNHWWNAPCTWTSAASRRDACIIAARPSRSRSTSSITP